MYRLYKLAKYKTVLMLAAVVVFGLMLAPVVFAGTVPVGGTCATTADCVANARCASTICVPSTGTDFGVGQFESDLDLGNQNLNVTVAKIINVALSLLGIVAVVIILIGGFRWMTAGGNDEKVTEARKWIFSGIIGLAIVLSAWAIARFVLQQLSIATNTGDSSAFD